jgi:pimeloyl-ACP methyl ester carboxylesterase
LPDATETFTVGTLQVHRYGEHGRPIILIPGLGSGAWVWADTIKHLRTDHMVYAVTLAGFDGLPAPQQKTGLLDQADASLLKLIESRHIDHPVLVGHSLGGTLAIRFAGEHSDLLGGVVAVDGLPVFPGAQDLTAEQRKARAGMFKMRMAGLSQDDFKAQQLVYMQRVGVIDQDKAACYAMRTGKSDPVATGEYAAEDYAADYRPGLKHVSVPLLEIQPYNATDYQNAAARTGQPVMTAEVMAGYYRKLLANDPQAKVVTIAQSRHFVMLDQPQKFLRVLDDFLNDLQGVNP